jgi:hypothetical protein
MNVIKILLDIIITMPSAFNGKGRQQKRDCRSYTVHYLTVNGFKLSIKLKL